MVDEQPWWVIEQLPYIARAYAEVRQLEAQRAQERAARDARG